MKNKAKYNCIENLKGQGDPIVIAAVTQEIEAIINACKENNIKISALCDNETRKVNKRINNLEVIHTPDLKKIFPKARIIVAYHNIDECIDQLSLMGFNDFYSPLELLKKYDVAKYNHKLSQSYIKNKIWY